MGKIAWKRILKVTLYNDSGEALTFGNEDCIEETYSEDGSVRRTPKVGLRVEVSGTKYLSSMKDEFTIFIYNLDWMTIMKINGTGDGKTGFHNVRIEVGYKSLNNGQPKKIFEGGVMYVSNNRSDLKQNKTILICTSKLIANAYKKRMNLTLSSGLNMYAAYKYLANKAGLTNIYVTPDVQNKTISNDMPINGDVISIFDNIVNSSNNLTSSTVTAVSTDSTTDADGTDASLNVLSLFKTPKRTISINASDGLLINKYASVTTEGINFDALCTINLSPGDLIRMDNSLIDVSAGSKSEAIKMASTMVKIDQNTEKTASNETTVTQYGYYYVWQVSYHLDNAYGDFTQSVVCKSRNLLSGITSDSSDSE